MVVVSDAELKTQPISQPQAAIQASQPLAAASSGGMNSMSGYRFHWTHAVYAIGLLAASGAGSAVVFKVQAKEALVMLCELLRILLYCIST